MTRMLRRWASAAVLASALAPTAAMAEWSDSAYISLGGLYLLPATTSYSVEGDSPTREGELKLESGMGFLLAVGIGDEVGLRGEVEFGYRKMDWDEVKGPDDTEFHEIVGDYTTLSLMANGLYVFEVSDVMRPYFGAGLGMAKLSATQSDEDGDTSDDDTIFAYQAMVGVGFVMAEQTEVRVGYRYFATEDADFSDEFGVKANYDSHSIEAGIRFRF